MLLKNVFSSTGWTALIENSKVQINQHQNFKNKQKMLCRLSKNKKEIEIWSISDLNILDKGFWTSVFSFIKDVIN